MFFSQTRDNWPFNTGIEIFWLEMHFTSMMWYLYILMRKIVNESQRTEFKGLQEFEFYLFIVRGSDLYPFVKLSHIKIFGLFTHHE